MRTVTDLRVALAAFEQEPPPLERFFRNIPGLATAESSSSDIASADDCEPAVQMLESMLADAEAVEGPARVGGPASAVVLHPRRRRWVIAAVATVAIVGGGSVAAAAGVSVIPRPVRNFFDGQSSPGAINPIPSTARMLFTTPGPDGVPMQLWYSDATSHGYCTALLEPDRALRVGSVPPPFVPQSAVGPANQPAYDLGGACSGNVGDSYWKTFGADGSGTGGPGQVSTFTLHVPGATAVAVSFDDGTIEHLPIADDFTAGWLTAAQSRLHPILVGYNAAGAEIGRVAIDAN